MAVQVGRQRRWCDDGGYAMVALLVAMSVMGVMMSIALPAWTTAARREKEAELVFRGEQYARAIALFQRKNGNAIPPNVDILVNEKFLRKRYKDPITGGDFLLLTPGTPIPGQEGPPTAGRGGSQPGRGAQPGGAGGFGRATDDARQSLGRAAASVTGGLGGGNQQAPFIGVASRSTETSLRLYNGRNKYNEWVFLGTQQSNRAGGVPGGARPGGPGGAPVPGVPGRGTPRGGSSPRGRLSLPGGAGAGGGISFPEAGSRRGGTGQ